MSQLYVLFEHAVGYCLFRVKEFEEIGSFLPQVEEAVSDVTKFKKVVHHVGFRAFKNAATALANINAVSEGIVTQELSAFLETNMPKPGKKDKINLGVCDPKLGAAISEALGYSILHTGVVPEVLRGIRCHLDQFIKGLNSTSMKQSELGLGHSYSRGKVKFNIHKVDNMIIQSIALLDQLDKDINTFSMRIREWYSYHFPELAKVVTDNYQYALCAHLIKNRNTLSPEMLDQLEEITNDSAKAQSILDVAKMSMGMDIAPLDLLNIEIFAKRVAGLAEYRKSLSEYLKNKMKDVAPNLLTLIGESVGARLISHAGSLTNLAKCPASTVQILGAEKALFRALKLRTATPKYGLIYHSTFIGKAGSTNKGRISRYLANKCSLASRIDCFSEVPTSVFGEKLRDQVEERLKFYESGDLPRKNVEVMIEAVEENAKAVKKIQRKRKKSAALDDTQEFNGSLNAANCNEEEENGQMPSKKKKKKDKKNKLNLTEEFQPEMSPVPTPVEEETPGKKRKKNKRKVDEEEQEFSPPVLLDSTKKKNKKMKLEPEGGEEDTMIDSSFLNDSKIEASSGKKKKKKNKKKNSMPVGNESSS